MPQQPLFEFNDDEPMQQDVRPGQLLERLATKTWGVTDETDQLVTVLPSEVNVQPVEDVVTSFTNDNQAIPSEIIKTDDLPVALNPQLEWQTELDKQAGQSPISVYSGQQNHSAQRKQPSMLDDLSSSNSNTLIKAALDAQNNHDHYQQQNQQSHKKSIFAKSRKYRKQ